MFQFNHHHQGAYYLYCGWFGGVAAATSLDDITRLFCIAELECDY